MAFTLDDLSQGRYRIHISLVRRGLRSVDFFVFFALLELALQN